MARVAVILSGSGVYDGSELHEAVLTLLHLDDFGAEIKCFAPDIDQMHVINHAKGEPEEGATRNVLEEAARISRGEIEALSEIDPSQFDALVIPGGFGAAKNLCSFAVDGPECSLNDEMEKAILGFHSQKKPVAPMCIAPAAVARALGKQNIKVKVTIGTDADTAGAIEAMGAEHVNCEVDDIVVDTDHKIISTPAYMLGPSISSVNKGIRKLVSKVIDLS